MPNYKDIGLKPLEETVIEQKKKPKKDHDEYRTIGLKDNMHEAQD